MMITYDSCAYWDFLRGFIEKDEFLDFCSECLDCDSDICPLEGRYAIFI